MPERDSTASKSTGRRIGEASIRSKHTVDDFGSEEPTAPSPRNIADKLNSVIDHDAFQNHRYRDVPVAVHIGHRFAEVAGREGLMDDITLGYPAVPMQLIIKGGTGGGGGYAVDGSTGGDGGVGEEGLAKIGYGLAQVGETFFGFIIGWWQGRGVPRGIPEDMFFVMDPEGVYIAVQLHYCPDYWALHEFIKTCLRRKAGARYVERGDYSIVSEDGSFIVPARFAETVKAGMLLEISILQRQVQNRIDTVQHTTQATTGNGWFKCANPTCARTYRIDEQNQDLEEIVRPQLQQLHNGEERKSFRRVHIHIMPGQQWVSLLTPQAMPPRLLILPPFSFTCALPNGA
ncbi:hypothetical protein B0H14DRAFT_2964918 [Mycena olivaceomarginata]|nr:hypothetical protein B0H14DRAFT_2964918 [Mycena olivaceomarginata]